MKYHLSAASKNRKTGPMPVVTADQSSCPSTCPLKGAGCYAEHGHLGMFWRNMKNTFDFDELVDKIRALPRGQVWRYGQAGDLPDSPDEVLALADANRNRPVICYTHKRDIDTYREAAQRGFNINLSASTVQEADELATTGLPVAVVLPSSYRRNEGETLEAYRERLGGSLRLKTPAGNSVAICPEAYTETTCLKCQACSKPRPGGTMIGFPAHGAKKKSVPHSEGVIPWKKPSTSSPTSQRISP